MSPKDRRICGPRCDSYAGDGNWEGKIPEVHRRAYDYSKPGYEEDFVQQHIPLKEGEEELQH